MRKLALICLTLAGALSAGAQTHNFDRVAADTGCLGEGCGESFCKLDRGETEPAFAVCTSTVQAFVVTGGDVGIGTSDPSAPIHVVLGGSSLPTINANTGILVQNNAAAGDGSVISIAAGNTGDAQLLFGDTGDDNAGRVRYNHADDSMRLYTNAAEQVRIDSSGNVSIGGTSPKTDLTLEDDGILSGAEQDTPPAGDAGFWYMSTDSNGRLWLVDGSGAEHTVHFDALGELSYHDPTGTTTVTIAAQDRWVKVDSFDAVGVVDDTGNVTGSTSTNDLTIGTDAVGIYGITYGVSGTVATAPRNFVFAAAVELATAPVITGASGTPIRITTSLAHGLTDGDGVEISGVGGNTPANTSAFVDVITTTTFDMYDLDKSAIASGGAYTSGGTIDWQILRQCTAWRTVNNSNIGDMGRNCEASLLAGDAVFVVLSNVENTSAFTAHAANLNINRRTD